MKGGGQVRLDLGLVCGGLDYRLCSFLVFSQNTPCVLQSVLLFCRKPPKLCFDVAYLMPLVLNEYGGLFDTQKAVESRVSRIYIFLY